MAKDLKENRRRQTENLGRKNKESKLDGTEKKDKRSKTKEVIETAYERLNKSLKRYEKAIEENPDNASAWKFRLIFQE